MKETDGSYVSVDKVIQNHLKDYPEFLSPKEEAPAPVETPTGTGLAYNPGTEAPSAPVKGPDLDALRSIDTTTPEGRAQMKDWMAGASRISDPGPQQSPFAGLASGNNSKLLAAD